MLIAGSGYLTFLSSCVFKSGFFSFWLDRAHKQWLCARCKTKLTQISSEFLVCALWLPFIRVTALLLTHAIVKPIEILVKALLLTRAICQAD
jgi:hypothetical protein